MITAAERERILSIEHSLHKMAQKVDISMWEAPFFLEIIYRQEREIERLKK